MPWTDPLSEDYPPFEIPKSILEQLNECSNGGYILFYVDNFGSIKPAAKFDSPIVEVAIRTRALEFLTSIKRLSQMASDDTMMEQSEMLDDEDEDE